MTCPDCDYMMTAFDKKCPRCEVVGKPQKSCLKCGGASARQEQGCIHCGHRFGDPVEPVASPVQSAPVSAPAAVLAVSPPPVVVVRTSMWSVFWGIILAVTVIVIVGGLISSANHQEQEDQSVRDTCHRLAATGGGTYDDCVAEMKKLGH